MNWKHIHLIFLRELNDQLRDRRTLFTITVLPLLLYPLLGLLLMQIAQFSREQPVRIRLIGAENWPSSLPLLNEQGTLAIAAAEKRPQQWVQFDTVAWPSTDDSYSKSLANAQAASKLAIAQNIVDAVLIVEPGFAKAMLQYAGQSKGDSGTEAKPDDEEYRGSAVADDSHTNDLTNNAGSNTKLAEASELCQSSGLHLMANMARDQSQIAHERLNLILAAWKEQWLATQLESAGLNPGLVNPLRLNKTDTAPSAVKRAMLWSKVLPFVMLVWALTGAFYPAIDLCAGEKERGTMETLLSSPARRREIVWGKLLTISVFSTGSALLNLMSMHFTAGMVVKQLALQGGSQLSQSLGPMPFHAFGWLVLLLLPMAAFFSALALAVAALARSTKEGQYYLMPLLLVTLPLVALPMLPSLELNLGTSLVPVAGAVFLVRSLIEGNYAEACVHLPVVLMVTICCCSISIRWAIRQFESESVMFRESDRWNLRLWMHQLWRDRGDTASPTESVLCGAAILVAMFFAQFVAGSTIDSWASIVKSTVTVQLGIILTPCLLMAIFLTRKIRHALRLHRVQPTHVAAAILLGISMHPSYVALGQGISSIYQVGEETRVILAYVQQMILSQPLLPVLLVIAVLPAICEELAFRGFIFGGLLHHGGVVRAIVVSALFFGFTHTVLQQSISACMMGLVLGFIAWRTGGVVCTILVHMINNALTIGLAWSAANGARLPWTLEWAISTTGEEWSYRPEWTTVSVIATVALLAVLARRDFVTQQVVQAEMV
ncbi:MAG: CPBP family intramembrane metalloprotease [Planctomycetales bacterium]|nr:CPBP family intramembrane metalloprotease [Planctomycetales bacterium]